MSGVVLWAEGQRLTHLTLPEGMDVQNMDFSQLRLEKMDLNKWNSIDWKCLLLEGLLSSYSLLFPTTVSLITCFLSVVAGEKHCCFCEHCYWCVWAVFCLLTLSILCGISPLMFVCAAVQLILLFSCLFFSLQGIYKYLERNFSDFKQRGFVVGYDTRGQVTSNCSSKKYEYWLHLQD